MRRIWLGRGLMAAIMLLFSAVLVIAEEPRKNSPPSQASPPASPSEKKPKLTDIVRVSTDQAIQSAAQKEAKKSSKDEKDAADSGVLEFHAGAIDSNTGNAVVAPSGSKRVPLKNIHGTVFGSADSHALGTHGAGGAVGATSKSGKSSIYIETDHARADSPR
jgi:hypothetical protein